MSDNSKLVAFLYLLMRDELPTGKVEHLMREVEKIGSQQALFSGGFLEAYAQTLADRLRA